MTTKIQKWGNSQAIRIPKHILESLKWNDDEDIVLTIKDGKVVIERAYKRKNIKELFADFEGEYTPVEMDWGEPVGEEVW
ncbi:MAG: AbrB/MazE/SpoVT family DNA-binding domain-containing protein [Bacillota bacterium]|nr:AbrB/MazE/SpoVT family DNA-binding domain-containing protein [Bacillota bacterium]